MLVFVIDDLAAVAVGPLLSAVMIIEATGFGRPSSQSALLLFLKRMIESKVIIRSRGLRDGSSSERLRIVRGRDDLFWNFHGRPIVDRPPGP